MGREVFPKSSQIQIQINSYKKLLKFVLYLQLLSSIYCRLFPIPNTCFIFTEWHYEILPRFRPLPFPTCIPIPSGGQPFPYQKGIIIFFIDY